MIEHAQQPSSVERELAAHRLLQRYAASVDSGDAEAVASLFTPDGHLVVRDRSYAGTELVDFYRSRLTFPTLHFVTGIVTAERGDGLIDVSCGFFAIEMPSDGWSGVAGRDADVVRVGDGAARFVSRTISVHERVALARR